MDMPPPGLRISTADTLQSGQRHCHATGRAGEDSRFTVIELDHFEVAISALRNRRAYWARENDAAVTRHARMSD